jgi:hypothetical protein
VTELLWLKPDAAVKNSDTLWRYRKNFKFLKEVKILSEFFQNKLACPMPIYVSGRLAIKVTAYPLKRKNYYKKSPRMSCEIELS